MRVFFIIWLFSCFTVSFLSRMASCLFIYVGERIGVIIDIFWQC